MPWHAITRTKKKKKNGKVFAWNGALHVFYENELKKWLFFLFLNLYSLFRIFLIIFSFFFPIEWIFPSDFFILFIFAFKWKSIVFPHTTTLTREAFTNENWQVLKKHTEWTCTHTHTHPLLKEFFLHTQIANACNGIKYSTEFDDFVNVPGELFFLSPEKYFEGRLLIKTCYS